MGEILNSLARDPKLSHPTSGASKRAAAEKQARLDMERALAVIAGRDRVLGEIARTAGEDRAIACAEFYGLNADEYRAQREMRQQSLRQSTVRLGGFDPDEDPRVIALLQDGRSTMQQISQLRRQVVLEHMAQEQKIVGPPGSYPDEQEARPMAQRSVRSSHPAAQFNADLESAAHQAGAAS